MDTNEIMENEEVVDNIEAIGTSAEEIVKANTGKGFTVSDVLCGVLGCMVLYKYVIEPLNAKRKAKRRANELYVEACGDDNDDAEDVTSCDEDTDSEEN